MIALVVDAITFDGGLLLLDHARQRLLVYNATASRLWFSSASGEGDDELARSLAKDFGLQLQDAKRDVAAILNHWRSEGLISGSPSSLKSLGTNDLYSIDWVGQSEPRWSACWTCLIRDLVVSFSIEPARLVSPVRMLLQHLEVENIDPHTRFEIRVISQDGGVLIQDGIERMRASHPGAFKDSVHKAILETLHTGVEWLALIHGGALAFNRIGIGFPAPTGSGKSTLIAYLAKNGFEYFSDDILPITAPEGVILPWPLPLSIKSGSWDILLPLYPDLSRSSVFFTKGDRARLLKPCPALWDQQPVPLRYLVFPHFNPTAPNGLHTIPPLEVLEQLIRENTWLGHPLDKSRIESFLDWLGGIPAFALTYKDLPHAARCLEGLLTRGVAQ